MDASPFSKKNWNRREFLALWSLIGMIDGDVNSQARYLLGSLKPKLFYKNQRKEIPMAVSFLPRIDFKTVSAGCLEHIDAAGF
jgi:hypothetical protein